jgi:hypothetical protein
MTLAAAYVATRCFEGRTIAPTAKLIGARDEAEEGQCSRRVKVILNIHFVYYLRILGVALKLRGFCLLFMAYYFT